MSADEQIHHNSNNVENDGVSIGAASSVTFHMGSGTDDDTNRYMGIPGGVSYGVSMINTVACSITQINSRVLKTPMSVGTGGWYDPNIKVTKFTVTAGSATVVEVEAKW